MRLDRLGRRDFDDEDGTRPTLEAVLEHYEVDFNPHRSYGMARCPLHEDNTPSLSYNLDRQVWKCHSCHEGGDSYELIIKHETIVNRKEITFVGAKSLATSLALPVRDAGGGDNRLSGSAYGGRRSVPPRSRDRSARSGYVPAWRRQ
ncbi:CHC2 zinc finger domain-containing protein [Streptomyces sp. x-19]|uniref:CHC2 zinc finger domain-containing protein n=1 Tax=Streptomyces sp. x-19 TaxID=2789280 RepID=UPI0039804DB6